MPKTHSFKSAAWIFAGVFALLLGLSLIVAVSQNTADSKRSVQADSTDGAAGTPPLAPAEPVTDSPPPPTGPEASPTAVVQPPAPPAEAQTTTPALTSDKDLPLDFLDRIVLGNTVRFILPDGRRAEGAIELMDRDAHGVLFVQGRFRTPEPGFFFMQRQTTPGIAGPMVGHLRFDGKDEAWKIEPNGNLGAARFNARKLDEILCVNYSEVPEEAAQAGTDVENAPQTHPSSVPIPSYQTIIPLQSLPGATAVIYLDFDGEEGPFPGWATTVAAPANATNAQIFDVWKMVSEDFQGFNINVTTDRKVFDNAPEGRRSHCIITPTTTAAPGAGGVAYVGSFNWSGDRVCWAFYSTGKSSCEVISHEVGHTLGLSHDGRISPDEGYYGGHGTDPTGWAPIMGVGYYKKLSQWSKGEYLSANQKQDDLTLIDNNNDVSYRTDDIGDVLASSRYLEIASNNSVSNEGIIERTGDIDSFRFVTTGGLATLNVNPVTLNPNLDILAEIVNPATDTVVASDNPDLDIKATVSSNLPAGEYLLRIRGTGRGDPLGDGYTNYGSIGSYLITGSVAGGIKPERFTVAENSANGTSVGTVVPRNAHAGATLAFAIAGGNTGGAFAIDPLTGAISVADSTVLNYETLSLRWDDPATIELFVTITNASNPSLDESLRTVITVSNLNEAPTVTGGSRTILEHTSIGTDVMTVTGSDLDRFDFPAYSITAGNTGNVFSINSGTGKITVAANIDVTATTVFNLTVRAADQGSPSLTSTANVAITVVNTADGYQPGKIVRTYFDGISGSTVANLTGNAKFPNNPDSEEFLTSFDGAEHGDNFGSTIRGYLIPPTTGNYQFWIASDDASELRLSTNATPASATVKATVSGWTNQYAWTANASQQSASIALTAGQPYYIEARHKEGGGGDHLAVAWSGPGITRQVISGLYLAPYYQNYAPKVNSASFSVRESALAGQPVGTVTSRDVNSQDTFSAYAITGGNTGGVFGITPATGQLFVAQSGLLNAATTPSYTLTIRTTDNGSPALNGTGTVTVTVTPAAGVNVTGIVQEIWTGISGTALSGLTGNTNYPYRANVRRTLTAFDSVSDYADNYGSRIRAKFIPAVSGDYRFYISSDDESRLLFSANESGSGAAQIANISGYTSHNVWTTYTSQTSAVKTLVAGQAVYLETLQKEGGGGDHVSVGYTGPDTSTITVIPGSMLQPFDINAPPVFSPASYTYNLNGSTATAGMTLGTVSATDPNLETLVYAIVSGNTQGSFAINSSTGAITVANPATLTNGDVNLQVAAQDGGLAGAYPLDSATATVVIHVTGLNVAPAFVANPFTKPDATEDLAYSQSLAGSATDANPGDTLTFSKISGPAWLSVATNGSLSGTPAEGNIGTNSFVVRVTDTAGLFAEATLTIHVAGVNEPPVFTTDPVNANTLKDLVFAGSVTATDPDSGDTRVYSKTSGPSWLNVASNGTFSGTPLAANTGLNTFILRVTDAGGLFDECTLNVTVIANPTWINPAGGSWTTSSNWLGGIVGTGADRVIDFSTLNLGSSAAVSLNGARTAGHLVFADTTASHDWILNQGSAGPLTLNVSAGVPSIAVNNQSATLNTPIAGTQGLVKTGAGTMILAGANSYTGATTLSNGTLVVTGSLANTSTTVGFGTTLAGNGIIAGPVAVNGTLAPGSTGIANLTVNQMVTLAPDCTLDWQIADWTGSAGTGYDLLTTNGLNITAGTENKITIRISGTAPAHFTETNKTFTLIANSGTTTGFNSAKFALDTTAFTAGLGTWAIQQSANNIVLVYSRPNAAPGFTTNPILLGATQDQPLTGYVSATDPDPGETLTYIKISGPAWLTVSSSGILGGTPANPDVGAASFVIGVTDSFGASDTAVLDVTVANINDAPAFTIPVIAGPGATQDAPYTATLAGSATDPDTGDTLSFSKTSGPAWLNIAADGALTGTPANADAGANSFTVRITDAAGLFAEASLEINVANINDAPAFTIPVIAGSGATQDAPYTATLAGSATDPDTGETLTFSKTSGPAWLNITADGALAGTPANGDVGANSFVVRITDAGGLFAEATLEINVTNINDAPAFTIPMIAGSGATQDAPYTATLAGSATDPDTGDTLSFSKTSGPAWLNISTDGALTGIPANGDVGANSFTVRITDAAGLFAEATLEINVTNINDAPVFTIPVIAGSGATQDAPYTATLADSATDPDLGDTLTFSKTSGPAWLNIAADGALTGTPANGDVGANSFTVRFTDSGNLFAEATLEINVANINDAPAFTIPVIAGSGATQDAPYTATLAGSATDPDTGDTLSFSKTSGPAWLNIAADGALTGTPANGDAGANSFTVRITDAAGLFAEASLEINVANINDAPAFTLPLIAGSGATQDAPYTATLAGSATDPDTGETLTFSKISGPAWLGIAANGALTGTPEAADLGLNRFTVRVTDAGTLFAEATLEIQVLGADSDGNGNGILDTWETEKFGNANPGSNPADQDADQDGLSNLMEFALGTHPAVANASPLETGFATVETNHYLQLTVPKNPAATNLSFVVETCGNLDNTGWSATNTVIVSETATQLIVRDAESVESAQRRFIRLRIQTLP